MTTGGREPQVGGIRRQRKWATIYPKSAAVVGPYSEAVVVGVYKHNPSCDDIRSGLCKFWSDLRPPTPSRRLTVAGGINQCPEPESAVTPIGRWTVAAGLQWQQVDGGDALLTRTPRLQRQG